MGSNAIIQLEEDLCCPVCRKPLSSPGLPPKSKLPKFGGTKSQGRPPYAQNAIQSFKDTRVAVGKFKDNEEIVVAQCGHLFHKFCLRHYCFLFREGQSDHMCKVYCPQCQQCISMMKSHFIDYKAHQNKELDDVKLFPKTSIMNKELCGQVATTKTKLKQTAGNVHEGNQNLKLYRAHCSKLKKDLKQIRQVWQDIERVHANIEQSDRMITFMKNQHLKIVRKFIAKMKGKPAKDFIHFPRRLAPFLHIIEEDDTMVSDLGEIIVPLHMHDLKSDRQSILRKLLTNTKEKLKELKATEEQEKQRKENYLPRKKSDRGTRNISVNVKVKKSSISILSNANLSEKSLQSIVQTVESPVDILRKTYGNEKGDHEIIQLLDKASHNVVDKVSASDIKIIYMPKRRMVMQCSQPCRNLEENDSFCVKPSPRRCKSTEAILIKSKKKTLKQAKRERSRSVTNITPNKKNSFEKVIFVTQNIPVPKEESNLGAPEEYLDEIREKPLPGVDKNNNRDDCSKQADTHQDLTQGVSNQTASVLQLIYDKVEEERKSHFDIIQKYAKGIKDVLDDLPVDDNGNELLQFEDDLNPPVPQLFRLDKRGFPYVDDSNQAMFREPSFLSSLTSIPPNESSYPILTGWDQPDEENQLNALTPEENFLRVSELEQEFGTTRSTFNYYNTARRRPVFHGSLACIAASNTNCNNFVPETTFYTADSVPFYLQRWRRQLPSRKILPAVPDLFRHNCHSSLSSSRDVILAKCTLDRQISDTAEPPLP